jgi:hypothetical protein
LKERKTVMVEPMVGVMKIMRKVLILGLGIA